MRNQNATLRLVPTPRTRTTPDGDSFTAFLRQQAAQLASEVHPMPHPRWVLDDLKRSDRDCSAAQVHRALSLLAAHPMVTPERLQQVAVATGAFLCAAAGKSSRDPRAAFAAETRAQAEADIAQVDVLSIADYRDRVRVERAIETTERHAGALQSFAAALRQATDTAVEHYRPQVMR